MPHATAPDWRLEGTPLSPSERSAMREFKRVSATPQCWGTRRMKSMLTLEQRGLVERMTYNGRISDWRLTPSGREWAE